MDDKERKQKEAGYYDKRAEDYLKILKNKPGQAFEKFDPFYLESYNFLRDFLRPICVSKKILDYGCGSGVHSLWMAKSGADVKAIDLSAGFLSIAKDKIIKERLQDRVEFLLMDCEKLNFPENYFDIIFDGGTFSSLDFEKVMIELSRVLKPGGFVAGIETLGHNPIANLRRKFNKLAGRRTNWVTNHVFKIDYLNLAKKYFNRVEAYYFHSISWLAFPFLNLPGGTILLKFFENIDHLLISVFPFFKKYSFKIVFIFSEPKNEAHI